MIINAKVFPKIKMNLIDNLL